MIHKAAELRKHSRIPTLPRAASAVTPNHPILINVSPGGACLWLSEAPPVLQYLDLHFRCKGRQHVLRSRIMWSLPCASMPNRNNIPSAEGWFTGISFTRTNTDVRIADIPHDILHAGEAAVSFHVQGDGLSAPHASESRSREDAAVPAVLREQSLSRVKAATSELLPVFAKHFSDIRVVFTRDRLEISASFRDSAERPVPDGPGPHPSADRSIELPASPTSWVAEPARPTMPLTQLPAPAWYKRRALVIAGAALIVLGAIYLALSDSRHQSTQTAAPVVAPPGTPVWTHGLDLDTATLDGWIEVKRAFDLPDDTLRGLIVTMRNNDKYPSAHDLHDLARYPAQTRRALSLLASALNDTATTPAIGALKDDLESRLMAGARFPDEASGGRYSSLQRELYHNLVVLSVVDLLERRQTEPAVRQTLAALQRGRPD